MRIKSANGGRRNFGQSSIVPITLNTARPVNIVENFDSDGVD
jgi:hypothetical protein